MSTPIDAYIDQDEGRISATLTDIQAMQCMRALCALWAQHSGAGGKGQRASAAALHVDERTMRYWCDGQRRPPWAAMELLHQMVLTAIAIEKCNSDEYNKKWWPTDGGPVV